MALPSDSQPPPAVAPLDPPMAAAAEADPDDTAPVFVDPADVVEVQVDDDVPMDDDEEQMDECATEEADTGFAPTTAEDDATLRLATHTASVFSVAAYVAPDQQSLAILSGGGDDRAFLHRIRLGAGGGDPPVSLPLDYAHTDSVSCVAHNLDFVGDDLTKTPRLVAVGGYDGAIAVYDFDTGQRRAVLQGPTDVEWLAFHPRGGAALLAGSAADGTVWLFHVPLQRCLQVFVGHERAAAAGAFSPDGRWALSAGSDGALRVWAPRTGAAKHVIRCGGSGDNDGPTGLTCMSTGGGADQQLVLVGAEDGQAHVCHIGTGKVVASLRHYEVPPQRLPPPGVDEETEDDEGLDLPMSVEAVGFAPAAVHPHWCATGGVDGALRVWDLQNGQCRHVCRAPSDEANASGAAAGVTRLQWHPTLPLVLAGGTDGSVRLWDARTGALLRTLHGGPEVVNDMVVAFPEAGRRAVVVTAGDDHLVRVHEVDVAAVWPGCSS